MKKLLILIICWGMLYGLTNAQSLATSNVTPIIYGDTLGSSMVATIHVTNVSNIALNVKVKRTVIDSVNGSSNAMAWDTSYPPFIDETGPLMIDSGQTYTAFQGLYFNDGNPGTFRIQYCFFDESNPSDSVCETITFTTDVLGISDNGFGKAYDLNVFPNPVDQELIIDMVGTLDEVMQIRLLDLTGRSVAEATQYQLDVSAIKSGFYLCEVTMQSGAVISKHVIKL